MSHTKGTLEYSALNGTQTPATLFIKDDNHPDVDIAVFEKWETDWAKKEMEANAKELVRRWNAFEEGGIVDELRKACEDALKKLNWPIYTEREKLKMKSCREKLKAAIAKVS